MGYTHYWLNWDKVRVGADAEFALWSADVRTLIDSLFLYPEITEGSFNICGPDGTGQPIITDRLVALNGEAEEDEEYESFIIGLDNPVLSIAFLTEITTAQPDTTLTLDTQLPFSKLFCKTACEPYDLVVTAALIRLAYYFPQVEIASDGDQEDWQPASTLCQKIFGEGDIPFKD